MTFQEFLKQNYSVTWLTMPTGPLLKMWIEAQRDMRERIAAEYDATDEALAQAIRCTPIK
jgi:hypothetical protein